MKKEAVDSPAGGWEIEREREWERERDCSTSSHSEGLDCCLETSVTVLKEASLEIAGATDERHPSTSHMNSKHLT